MHSFVKGDWNEEALCHWKELKNPHLCPSTGLCVNDKEIRGVPHDPNAYALGEFCSHAGLFATLDGLAQTLFAMNRNYQLIERVQQEMKRHSHRFVFGLDRVEDVQATLAGKGCSLETFGHLGFTGTSFWIDAHSLKGHIILTNATNKEGTKDFRRSMGEILWRHSLRNR